MHNLELYRGVWEHIGHEMHYANYDGVTYLLFCAQYGKTSPNGGTYVYDTQFKVQLNSGAYHKIAEYIYFGYTMKYGTGLPTTTEAKIAACSTQQFVWEYIRDNITAQYGAPSRNSWNSSYMSSSIYSSWLGETESIYNNYHNGNVSFNNQTGNVAIGETKTFTDTNGVLSSYPSFTQTSNGVTFNHTQGSNDLIVTVDKNSDANSASFLSTDCGVYRLMPNGAQYSSHEMSNYMYFHFTSGSIQDLIFSSYVDPTFFNFNIQVESGKIAIKKTDNTGTAIAGCTFKLYRDENCSQEVSTGVSSSNGTISFEKLKPGTYYIKEVGATSGYLTNNIAQTVNVKNGETTEVNFQNVEPTGEITIVKKDSETGLLPQGDATLENAVYKVYAAEDIYNVAKTKKFYNKGDLVATRTTNDRGEMQKITEIPLGHYIVKEEVASNGYLLDETEYDVNLTYKDQVTDIISAIITSNEQVKKQQIHIYKSGIKIQGGLVDGLEGAEFTIKLLSDVDKAINAGYTYEEIWNGIDEYGNKIQVDSKRVAEAQVIAPTYQTVRTDENGNAYTKELPYGKFICKETLTPKDFYTAEDFTFTISQDVSEIKEVAQKVKDLFVNNEQMETYIKLVKKDVDSGKNVTLNSATFQIKATKDIYDRGNGKIIYKNGEVITQKIGSTVYNSFTTNSDNIVVPDGSYTNNKEETGSIITPLKLPVGSYEISEIQIPNGFLQLDKTVEFNIEGLRDYDKDNEGDYIKEVIIENAQPKGTLIIDKSVALREDVDTSIVDTSDFSGIKFKLVAKEDIIDYSDGSIVYKKGQEINTYNLDRNGDLKIEELWMGSYELQEVETLPGLVLDDAKYEVEFTQKDTTTKVYTETKEIVNDTTLTEFSKTDITGQEELKGAILEVKDKDGNIVDTWVSGDKKHSIEGLKVNEEYTLIEKIQVDDYVKATDIKFIIENDKTIKTVTMIDKIVDVTKTDFITGEEIEGAELIVTDEDGNEIDRWISEKTPHHVKGLEEGKKYILTEITCPYRI